MKNIQKGILFLLIVLLCSCGGKSNTAIDLVKSSTGEAFQAYKFIDYSKAKWSATKKEGVHIVTLQIPLEKYELITFDSYKGKTTTKYEFELDSFITSAMKNVAYAYKSDLKDMNFFKPSKDYELDKKNSTVGALFGETYAAHNAAPMEFGGYKVNPEYQRLYNIKEALLQVIFFVVLKEKAAKLDSAALWCKVKMPKVMETSAPKELKEIADKEIAVCMDLEVEFFIDMLSANVSYFDRNFHRSENPHSQTIDAEGFNREGFNREGYDREGYGRDGYNQEGFNREGYNSGGYDKNGYNEAGFDKEGYTVDGIDKNGYNKEGYDKEGYHKDGFNRSGYNREGYGRDGYNKKGVDKYGYTKAKYEKNKKRGRGPQSPFDYDRNEWDGSRTNDF